MYCMVIFSKCLCNCNSAFNVNTCLPDSDLTLCSFQVDLYLFYAVAYQAVHSFENYYVFDSCYLKQSLD